MKCYILLILLHLPIVTLGAETCKEDRHYKEFYELKKNLEERKETSEKTYNILKGKLNELETCYEQPMIDLHFIRNQIYSYRVNGKKTEASFIYDCDHISINNLCLKDNRVDWDWTERIYPRSSSKLRRAIPGSNQNMEFPFSVDGFELASITLTYINTAGIKEHLVINHYKKDNNYASVIINIKFLFDKNIVIDDQFSNCWLFSIYKNTNGKYLKVIWYYAGSEFLKDKLITYHRK